MKNQSSENELVITEEFIFDQNKLSKDRNNNFNTTKPFDKVWFTFSEEVIIKFQYFFTKLYKTVNIQFQS